MNAETELEADWGVKEQAARFADIAAVKSGEMTLEAAQKAARKRQRLSGLTPRQAYAALISATRSKAEGRAIPSPADERRQP